VKGWGFECLPCEWCVYQHQSATGTVIFAIYVDDFISATSSPEENEAFKAQLSLKWEISALGPAKFALGIAITCNTSLHTVTISQGALIDCIVEKFRLFDAHPVDTPMVAGLQLRRPDKSQPIDGELAAWLKRTPYRSLVGTLMYVAVGTRPDIAYAVGRLASYLDDFRPEHWEAALRVVRYLKGTRNLSLVLGGINGIQLSGFSDSDYANCMDTSRSISGYCFNLGLGVVSWCSRKQRIVADSSCYAEYIALHEASHELTFLRQLLAGLEFGTAGPTPLHCDNHTASILTEDHVWHPRVKHIRVKYHHVRELTALGEMKVNRVASKDNVADIFTKPLGKADFVRLRFALGVRGPYSTITSA